MGPWNFVPVHLREGTDCDTLSLQQGTLDSAFSQALKQPPFTTAGLLDHVVEMIVCEDEVSSERENMCSSSYDQVRHCS